MTNERIGSYLDEFGTLTEGAVGRGIHRAASHRDETRNEPGCASRVPGADLSIDCNYDACSEDSRDVGGIAERTLRNDARDELIDIHTERFGSPQFRSEWAERI